MEQRQYIKIVHKKQATLTGSSDLREPEDNEDACQQWSRCERDHRQEVRLTGSVRVAQENTSVSLRLWANGKNRLKVEDKLKLNLNWKNNNFQTEAYVVQTIKGVNLLSCYTAVDLRISSLNVQLLPDDTTLVMNYKVNH